MATYDKKFIIEVRPSLTDDARTSLNKEVEQMTNAIQDASKATFEIDIKRETRQKMAKLKKEMKEIAGVRVTGKTDLSELGLNEEDLERVTKKLKKYNSLKGGKISDVNSLEYDKIIKKLETMNKLSKKMSELDLSNSDDLKKGNKLLEDYETTAQSIARLGYDRNGFTTALRGDLESQNKSRINGEGIEETTDKMEKLKVETDQAEKGLKDVNVQLDKTGDSSKEVNKVEDGVDKIGKTAKKTAASIDKVNKELKDPKGRKNIDKTSASTDNLTKKLVNMSHLAVFTYVSRVLVDRVRESIRYIKELDVVLTEISVVTGKSREQVYELGIEFNDMAKRLGRSTAEVANASKIFFRQGKSTEQVMLLVEASTKAASVAHIDLAEASDYLTSTLNGFQMEATQAMEVVDKFSAVGANAGTSFEEMASALKKVASAASNANVDMDHMISYLATVSEVTREAPENIGTSFKTLFARMQKITKGDMPAELNKVDQALQSIGISLKGDSGQIKSLQIVVEQLGGKWESLTKNQQAYLATSIAGTRQQVRFISLMDNYDRSLEILDTSINSAGEGQRQFNNYLGGFEAKLKAARAEVEGLYGSIKNTGLLEKAVEAFTDFVQVLNTFVETGNVATPVMILVTAALTTLIAKLILTKTVISVLVEGGLFSALGTKFVMLGEALVTAATGATGATVALSTLLPVLALVAVAVGGLVYGGFKLTQYLSESATAFDEVTESVEDSVKALSDLSNAQSRLNALMKQRKDLTKELEDENTSYEESVKIKGKLLDINKELGQIAPEAITATNDQGEAIAIETEAIKENIKQRRKSLILEMNEMQRGEGLKFDSLRPEEGLSYKGIERRIKELQKTKNNLESDIESYAGKGAQGKSFDSGAKLKKTIELLEKYQRTQESFDDMKRPYFGMLEDSGLVGKTEKELEDLVEAKEYTEEEIIGLYNFADMKVGSLAEAASMSEEIQVELIPQMIGEERYLDGLEDLINETKSSPGVRNSLREVGEYTATELRNATNSYLAKHDLHKGMNALMNGKNLGEIPEALTATFENLAESLNVDLGEIPIEDLMNAVLKLNNETERALEIEGDYLTLANNLSKSLSTSLTARKEISGFMAEYNKNEKFSLETILKLVDAYPQLNDKVQDHAAIQKFLSEQFDNTTKSMKEDYKKRIFYSQGYTSQAKTDAEDLVDGLAEAMGIDLSNFKDLYSKKTAVLSAFNENVVKQYNNLMKALRGEETSKNSTSMAEKGYEWRAYVNAVNNNTDLGQYINIKDELEKAFASVELDSTLFDSDILDSGSDSLEEATGNLWDLIDAQIAFAEANWSTIEAEDTLLVNAEKAVENLEYRIKLEKDKQKLLKDAIALEDDAIKKLELKSQLAQSYTSGQGISDQLSTLFDDEIQEQLDLRLEAEEEIQSKLTEIYDKQHEKRMENENDEYEDFMDKNNKRLDAIKDRHKKEDYEKELKDIRKDQSKLQDRINEYKLIGTESSRKKILELQEEYNDLEEESDEKKLDKTREKEIEKVEEIQGARTKAHEETLRNMEKEHQEKINNIENEFNIAELSISSLQDITNEFGEEGATAIGKIISEIRELEIAYKDAENAADRLEGKRDKLTPESTPEESPFQGISQSDMQKYIDNKKV